MRVYQNNILEDFASLMHSNMYIGLKVFSAYWELN